MNLMELKKQLSTGTLKSLYIFTGEEVSIMDIYIDKISKMFNGDTVCAESVSSIVPRLKSNSLIFSNNCLYIIRDDKSILSADKVWESLKTGVLQKRNCLILVFNNLDKRGKFYKEFSDIIVSFDSLSEGVLLKYVNKSLSLSTDRAQRLISICQNNYNRMLLEMDKISCLSNNLGLTHNESFDMCLESNSFYIPPDGEIFDLLNAILSRDSICTYKQFQLFKQRGDSPIAILSLLHNNLKAILQVQFAEGHSNISQVTGLTGFQIKNAQKFTNRYNPEELIRIIRINRFCEKCIKQTGMMDIDMILDFLFIKIF